VASNPTAGADTLPDPPELASLRARVAALEARETEHARAEKVQTALYRIAEAATATSDLQAFYREVHATIATLMFAENFYIALYDDRRGAINFPYYIDAVDLDIPDPNRWDPFGVGNASGLTAYVLRTGKPALVGIDRHDELVRVGEIESIGVVGAGDWLGAPLKADEATVGVVVAQTYAADQHYTAADRDLLAFVGQHIGAALTRVRAIEETRQRNAELALVNDIGAALARQLDFAAIVDLVGERVREMFEPHAMFVALYDSPSNKIRFPYSWDGGARMDRSEVDLGDGLTTRIITTRRPVRVGSDADAVALGAIDLGGSETESFLGVPITSGDRVIGAIALEQLEKDSFSDSDERVLSTLASSMGVALENARLFDETNRLLTETNERAAELALINDVQRGLAERLDIQAMYDLVGDKIQEIFDAQVVDIGIFDDEAGVIRFPYTIERGVRIPDEPLPFNAAANDFRRNKQTLVLNHDIPGWYASHGFELVIQGEAPRSMVFVPLMVGDEVRGPFDGAGSAAERIADGG